MAEQALVFGNAQESGDSALAGASPLAVNVLVDGKGAARRRPGLTAYGAVLSDAVDPTGLIGLHVTAGDEMFAVGTNRHCYRLQAALTTDLSSTLPERLAGLTRPIFAENEVVVLVAGGDEIQKLDLTTFTSTRLNATSSDVPPKATHVIAHAQRILANDLTSTATSGRLRYSKTGQVDYDEWPGRYVLTAESKPDPVQAVGENINEVWAWGASTTQLFVPDASSVYAPSKTLKSGLSAPYSTIAVDDNFAWLDRYKRFVLSDGRSVTDISQPIARTLDAITTWDDCFGYRVNVDQFDCLVWTFPTDGRSFCYQLTGGWSQWQGRQGSNRITFPVTAHVFRESDSTDVVGLADGRVCKLATSASTDLGDPIEADVMTGYISRGTNAVKACVAVRLVLQRGETSSTTDEPIALLSWRDDGGAFEDPIPVGLGVAGEKEVVVELRSLGVYRRRQWRLTFTGSEEWVLAGATEEFTVGGN